jgi:predicted Zn finger-like uncharacterized protein
MLIVCPSCASSYSLSPEQLGPGRSLRCASCRTTWFARPSDAAEAAIPPTDPEPLDATVQPAPDAEGLVVDAAVRSSAGEDAAPAPPAEKQRSSRRPRARAPRQGRRRFLRLSPTSAAALALVALLVVGVTLRDTIVRLLPQTARLYATLGMPVNLRGLEFSGLRSELVADKDQSILVIEGEIRGVGAGKTTVPKLAISLRGATGQELYAWTSEAPRSTLSKGEVMPFRTRLVAPPAEGKDVIVRFADADLRSARTQ